METDRIIGALTQQAKHTEARLNRIESKLDGLLEVKWKMAGGLIVVAALVELAIKVAEAALRG